MAAPPYDRLFIYELTAPLQAGPPDPARGFLGCWREGGSSFLFYDRPARAEALRLGQGAQLRESFEMTYLDWQGGQALAPYQVGPLTIRPPWAEASGQEPEVIIDPSVVFGAGNHPTTLDSLAALVLALAGGPFRAALDLGCGAGILALAAARLGVDRVIAVDLNPLCAHVSQGNAELNNLADRVQVIEGDALALALAANEPGERAELVMANLDARLILELAGRGGLAGRRAVILSGVTRSFTGQIEAAATAAGLTLSQRWAAEATWFTYLYESGPA